MVGKHKAIKRALGMKDVNDIALFIMNDPNLYQGYKKQFEINFTIIKKYGTFNKSLAFKRLDPLVKEGIKRYGSFEKSPAWRKTVAGILLDEMLGRINDYIKQVNTKKWGAGWDPRMKITKPHYIKLEKAIHKVLALKDPNIYKIYMQRGRTNTRFNWDLFSEAGGGWKGVWSEGELDYLQDEHINTVLQKITGKKGKLR